MAWQAGVYIFLWMMTAAVTLALALWIGRRRPAPGVRTFSVLMLCATGWSVSQAMVAGSVTLSAKLLWAKVGGFSAVTAPVAWLAFVLRYAQPPRRLTRRHVALLAIEPFITMLLLWTNEVHGLMWSRTWLESSAGLLKLGVSYGAWFWANLAYSYFLVSLGALLLVQACSRAPRLYRRQGIGLLIGGLLPWIGSALYLVFPTVDQAVLALSLLLLSVVVTWSLLHLRLFALMPLAREAVVENMDEAMIVLDLEERIADLNPAAQRLLGHSASEVIGRTAEELFAAYSPLIARYRDLGEVRDEVIIGEGAQQRHFDLRVSSLHDSDGQPVGHLAVLHDIAARKQAEEALRASKQLLEKTFYGLRDAVFIVDADSVEIMDCNPAASEVFGYSREEMLGRTTTFLHVNEETLEEFRRYLYPAVEERGFLFLPEFRMKRKDGTVFPTEHTVVPLEDERGQRIGWVSVVRDITARKRAYEALRESEERYRHLFDGLPVGLYRTSPSGQILDANPALVQMFGYPDRESLLAVNAADIYVHAEDRRREQAMLERDGIVRGFEMQQRRYDGKIIWVRDTVRAVRDGDGQVLCYEGSLEDITERKRTQRELVQRAEELAALQATVLDITSTGGFQTRLYTLLQAIVERAAQLLNAPGGGLYLCDPERQETRCVVSYNTRRDYTGTVLKYGEGAAGVVAQTGKPLIIDDYRTWSSRATVFEEDQPFTAVLSAPMVWQGRVTGVIHVLHDVAARHFTPADLELLTLFANHAAVAVENARLYEAAQQELAERKRAEEELQRRNQQLAELYDIALEITSQLDLQRLLHTIVVRANDLMGGRGAGMYLYRPEYDDLEYVVGYKVAEEFVGTVLKRGEGLSGKVLESGRPMAVEDYHTWPGRSPLFEEQSAGAVAAVPVTWGGRILGVIDLQRETGATFSEEDIRLLTLFANQAAVAVANARLYAETQRRLQELEMLYQASTTITGVVELEKRLQLIMEAAVKAIPAAQKGSLHLLDEQRHELVMKAGYGFSREVMETARFKVGEGWAGWAFAHHQPLIVDNAQTDPRTVVINLPEALEEKSALVVPLIVEDKAIGTLTVDNITAYNAFNANDLRLLSAFAAQAAIAIENARLYDAAQQELAERKRAEQERRDLEAQLRQVQKMEAVGLLAGGVAHEFNNLLMVIQGSAELALARLKPSHRLYKELSTIQRITTRAAALTRQLLVFGRRQILQPQRLDLNLLVSEFARMLSRIIGEEIQLQVNLAPKVGPILADASAVEQVLMNLALNARDAMPQGGVLRLETAQVALDEAYCRRHPEARVGEYVRLTVADSGVGMDEATREHLFEPFFTTKEVGKGTGLGLAVAYGIVKQHGGFMEVESQPGQGSRFDVYLPVHRAAVKGEAEMRAGVVPRGTETILLAEDEQLVREFAQTVLEGLGYKVLLAGDGTEAVEVFAANPKGIDLVILDAMMPKLSGQKACAAIMALRPDVPVLFITGYSADLVGTEWPTDIAGGDVAGNVSATMGEVRRPVLQKPFAIAELGRRVREALDAARNR